MELRVNGQLMGGIRNGLRETPFFGMRFEGRDFSHETIRHFLVDLF
jgi:hypothetical protein